MAVGESWGRYPAACGQTVQPLRDRLAGLPAFAGNALPHGAGRSYGDSCLNPDGTLLHARGLDRFIAFDAESGRLRCEAGVTLAEILELVVPQGWFLAVVPGTSAVTVGGAIGNDVHGKNHHRAGSFGHHLLAFELLRSDGSRRICRADGADGANPLFAATIGGLGLTGLISWAELQLRRIPGPCMETEALRFDDLDGFFALSTASAADHEYTVAWIDCLARGRALGRGRFFRANHAPGPAVAAPAGSARIGMPFTPPLSLVNRLSLRLFNTLYFHRQREGLQRSRSGYGRYFFPLDGIAHWNRMYGPRGFLQHQCVLPPQHVRDACAELLKTIAASGTGSFLAVLKEFGSRPSLGMLSFPRPGTTLALDFPHHGVDTLALLDRLDAIVAAAGGALYPAKDARMAGPLFRSGFPRWKEFMDHIDPRFSSGFWRRVSEDACSAS